MVCSRDSTTAPRADRCQRPELLVGHRRPRYHPRVTQHPRICARPFRASTLGWHLRSWIPLVLPLSGFDSESPPATVKSSAEGLPCSFLGCIDVCHRPTDRNTSGGATPWALQQGPTGGDKVGCLSRPQIRTAQGDLTARIPGYFGD